MEIAVDKPTLRPTLVESNRPHSTIKPSIMKAVRAGIAEVMDGRPIYAVGIHISEEDIVSLFLPAVLFGVTSIFIASDDGNSRRTGFTFDIKAENAEVTMFAVSHISGSSSRKITSAVTELMLQSKREGEFVLDDMLKAFVDFVEGLLPLGEILLLHENPGKTYTISVPKARR